MAEKDSSSFMRSLCMGQIEQDILFPFPELPVDQKETLQGIASALEDLLGPREADFKQWDIDGDMPADFIDELRSFGLFGLITPTMPYSSASDTRQVKISVAWRTGY